MHERDETSRYLELLRSNLKWIRPPERDEVVREIASHIAEAVARGEDITRVLDRLGPPDRLARAYSAELLVDRQPSSPSRAVRWYLIGALLFTSGFASVIVVPVLLLSVIGLGLAGAATIILALALPWLPPGILQCADFVAAWCQLFGAGIGLVGLAIGLASAYALRAYLRFMLRSLRRGLPRVARDA